MSFYFITITHLPNITFPKPYVITEWTAPKDIIAGKEIKSQAQQLQTALIIAVL